MTKSAQEKHSKRRFHFRYLLRAFVDMAGIAMPFKFDQPKARAGGKRILVFNWRDMKHTYAGGAEVYVHELAKRWVDSGHQVTLFCGNDGESSREEIIDGIHIIRRGGFYFVYIWAFLYYLVRFRRQYDVIMDCHNGIPFFTPLYAREPVVCVVHHIHQEVFRTHLGKAQAALAMFLEAKVMPRAYVQSQYVAVSPSTKAEMEAMGMTGLGIEIVYNGVDLENLVPGIKAEVPLVVFLGRLQAYKSIDVLIKAFKYVKHEIPSAKLVIAGAGEDESNLKKLVKRQKLAADDITFTGRISETEKVNLLQRAWVAVNPSFMEGWGITIIEANACGTPVIGADVPGLRDSIKDGHTGMLVPHGKPLILAEHVTKLLINDVYRKKISKTAYDWSQKFHWNVSSDEMIDIFLQAQTKSLYVKVPIDQ